MAPKKDYQCICALRQKVGEIDPKVEITLVWFQVFFCGNITQKAHFILQMKSSLSGRALIEDTIL